MKTGLDVFEIPTWVGTPVLMLAMGALNYIRDGASVKGTSKYLWSISRLLANDLRALCIIKKDSFTQHCQLGSLNFTFRADY